jgi:hypothetical protein
VSAAERDIQLGLPLRLLLLIPLLHPVGPWWLRGPTLLLCILGIGVPRTLRTPQLWLGLSLLGSVLVAYDWPLPDNHLYLMVYAQLAVGIALWSEDACTSLARSARLLVAATFAFATLWKVGLSPDFVDGTFFRVTLLDDQRFEWFVQLAGGLETEQLEAAQSALRQHVDGTIAWIAMPELPTRFYRLADGLTAWTAVLEALVAVAFLWPRKRGPARLRNVSLLLFCTTTFSVATVAGFGWLLCALGLAQSDQSVRRTRLAYVGVFLLILLYRELPLARAVGV